MPRIAGIDLARALAIGGMFVAHLAARDDGGWWWIVDGRSSALFALLAGCGLGFMTARDGREHSRIIARAVWLGLLGIILMFLGPPIAIILSSYAVMFALTVPFLHLPPGRLLLCATGIIILAPPIVQGIRLLVNGEPAPGPWIPGLFEFATGYYPALAWLAYSLVGLALVRMSLTTMRATAWALLAGILAMTTGYGGGYWLTEWLGPQTSPYLLSLVGVAPHTDSGFEILGNIGACLIVIAGSMALTRLAPLRLLLSPLLAAGRMSLTLYVAHVFYIWALGPESVWEPASQGPLLWLIGTGLVFARAWFLYFAKGPLEWAIGAATPSERHVS